MSQSRTKTLKVSCFYFSHSGQQKKLLFIISIEATLARLISFLKNYIFNKLREFKSKLAQIGDFMVSDVETDKTTERLLHVCSVLFNLGNFLIFQGKGKRK